MPAATSDQLAQAVLLITTHDVRSVCDPLRPVYEATEGRDGRGSLEVDPRLAHDTDAPWPRRHDRRFGRRPLLLMGPVGMAVTPGTMAVIFGTAPLDAEGQPRLSPAAGPVALVVAKLYVFAVGMSWGPVVWVRLGEKFPNRIRAAALGAAEAAPWIANWLIPTTFPARSDIGLGLLAYGIYTASAILLFFFVVRFVSEAMGKKVEEMRV